MKKNLGSRKAWGMMIPLATLLLSIHALPASAQSSAEKVPGPWYNAKVGTKIKYRMAQENPYGENFSREVTEEAIAVGNDQVTVKITAVERGQAKEKQETRPRFLTKQQLAEFQSSLGKRQQSTPIVPVASRSYKCDQYYTRKEDEDGEIISSRTVLINPEVPGWLVKVIENKLTTFDLLSVQP